jgi:hypothetical protein
MFEALLATIGIPNLILLTIATMLTLLFCFMMMERLDSRIYNYAQRQSCATWSPYEWKLYVSLSIVIPLGILALIIMFFFVISEPLKNFLTKEI